MTTDNDLPRTDNSIPTMRRRPLPGGRQRRRAVAVDSRETGRSSCCLLGWLNGFIPFKSKKSFHYLIVSLCSLLAFCVFSSGQDVVFQTPVRPVLRREHILSEIGPVATRNTTNIYSPIVRFLSPSKESKCSCEDSFILWVGFKILNSLWEKRCSLC